MPKIRFFVIFFLLISAGSFAQTQSQVQPQKPAQPQTQVELRYPSIQIEVTEQKLGPDLKKDKEELIQSSRILEDVLHGSGAVYREPALEKAVTELIPLDQLGEEAKGFYFRVYLLKDPNMNAMAVPSGSIYVNSGLLAALENFDQLRAVMAHEAHHAIDQDIVYKFREIKNETAFVKVFNLLAAPAVAYAISESDSDTAATIANIYTGVNFGISIAYQLSLYGYGRGHENECDAYAAALMHDHGYDVREFWRVFDIFDQEEKKYSKESFRTHLFSMHETSKQRRDRIAKFAKGHGIEAESSGKVDRRYQELTKDIRIQNARLNVRMGRPQHAIDDLERLRKHFPQDPRVLNALGEAHAKLAEDRKILERELSFKEWNKIKKEKEDAQRARWVEEAVSFFEKAIEADGTFADPYRGQALLRETLKENDKAISLFEKYLELAPNAKDRRFAQAKVKRLRELAEKEKAGLQKEKGKKND